MSYPVILHSDLNSFYASVEIMLDPSLRGKAVAVCGCTEERHGIVLAKSEKAKKAGVKTGMANWEARQCCPGLITVPPQYDQYVKYSRLVRQIYQRYTDLIEPFGMDECWLDLTQSISRRQGAMDLTERIRREVREETGLTVSIGVSFNKIFAKLGSDMKKPDAVTVISPDNYREKVWPLPAEDMIYCGRATGRKLRSYGIHTIGELAQTPPAFLKKLLGVNGVRLWTFACGQDRSPVMPSGYAVPVKSVGHGITCSADLDTPLEVKKVMLELSQDIGRRLRLHHLSCTGVQIFVRGKDLSGRQYQQKLCFSTQLPSVIASAAFHLFENQYPWQQSVRAVTVRAIGLIPDELPLQMSFDRERLHIREKEQLQTAVESIRARFGKASLTYALLLGDLKIPRDGRDLVRMPGMMYRQKT